MTSGPNSWWPPRGLPWASDPALDGPDAGHELAEPERLHDVVVGSQLEQQDAVDLVGTCGHDDDRHLVSCPQPPAHLAPVEVGQTQVQEDEIRLARGQGLSAGAHPDNVEALQCQALDQRFGDAVVVLDHQYPAPLGVLRSVRLRVGRRHEARHARWSWAGRRPGHRMVITWIESVVSAWRSALPAPT